VWGVLGLGLQAAVPVTGQMSPGSYVIGHLNSPANVAREAAAIRNRAALLYVARNYPYGGPMRALDPDNADRFYNNMWWSIGILETAAAGLSTYYPNNANAMWIAHALYSAAGVVRQVDPMWCWLVTNDRTCGTWHDGIVPFEHQRLPAGTNIGIGGPAHLQEAKESGPIHFALVNYLGVGGRSGSSGSTGGGGGGDQLTPGQTLYGGQSRRSADDRFELAFQGDGNLVLYRRSDGAALWASHTQARDGEAVMQGDGNLVIYDSTGVPRWHSATHNFPGASLIVQCDGNVVIYDYYGFPIWATGTAQ
jgi:hypothetical protein